MPLETEGTVKVTLESDQELIVAALVPNFTLPVELPKPLPAMVTLIPGCPSVGPMEPTSGEVAVLVNCHTDTA